MNLTIKNTWEEVSVWDYQQIIRRTKEFDGSAKEPVDVIEYYLDILPILSNQNRSFFEGLTQVQFTSCVQHLEFISKMPKPSKPRKTYILDGKKYDMTGAPERLATASMHDLMAIQYLDFLAIEAQHIENTSIDMIDAKVSVILVQKGLTYGSDEFDVIKHREIIGQHLSITDALGICAFFLRWFDLLVINILRYLELTMKKAAKKDKGELEMMIMKVKNLRCQGGSMLGGVGVST